MVSRALTELRVQSAEENLKSGNYAACAAATLNDPRHAPRVLHTRALLRLGKYAEAAVAGNVRTSPLLQALRAQGLAAFGDDRGALEAVDGLRGGDGATDFEIAYARLTVAWIRQDSLAMRAALATVHRAGLTPWLEARWLIARSWIAAVESKFVEQARLLEAALALMDANPAAYDAFLYGAALQSLAHLSREIYAQGTIDLLEGALERFVWGKNQADVRFQTLRGIAWARALHGSYLPALVTILEARDLAPGPTWVACCYADQAYLERMAGGGVSAEARLRYAATFAQSIDWSMCAGEERAALLNLAELCSDADPVAARTMLDLYMTLPAYSGGKSLAHDRRRDALEAYARGSVLAAEFNRSEATAELRRAFDAFSSMRYAWRAAAAAMRLHAITGDDDWLRRAALSVADFPRSSVAGQIRKAAAGVEDPRYARLTAAQRRIFRDVCEGLSYDEIGKLHGLQYNTVKNHVAAIHRTFEVRSTRALIAEARRAGIAI